MLKKIVLVLLIFTISFVNAHQLRGIVTSSVTKEPLQDVGVYNKTSGAYTYTNVSGFFEFDAISVDDVLYFQQLGYDNYELTITKSHLDGTVAINMLVATATLDQVLIVSKLNVLSSIVNVDVQTNPVKSSQDILRKVPGLIIGQHAGGGKAEQIFLRGFDIDHGTDIAIDVDGMPVNMVSHAHGQGYADLHFVIPETIDHLDFGKGAYYTDKGNFNTAGYVDLKTKTSIDENVITLEAGQFNTVRALSMVKLLSSENSKAYMASEMNVSDGVFESSQNFNRFNVMGRYSFNNFEDETFNVALSHFQSKWDASGQIPQRAVDQGLIGRFGAIDDTEGGNTSRTNIWLQHHKQLDAHAKVTTSAYLSRYDFELFSNFTFFLEDPINADQIRQFETRTLAGAKTAYKKKLDLKADDAQLNYELGLGFRYDNVDDIQLSRTRNRRQLLERLAFGDVDEFNGFSYANLKYTHNKWTLNPGLRLDYFTFDYVDFLTETFNSRREHKALLSPKLNVIYAASPKTQVFLKTGLGFHSNDSRVVTANEGQSILPVAFSSDLGIVLKPTDEIVINAAVWQLFLEQEFVYVGDAGIVEPSGRSQRLGVDVGMRYQITDQLYFNTDVNYAYARSIDAPSGEDFIPLAPDLTFAGGLSFKDVGHFSGGLDYRYLKDRPANEDNSIAAEGYFVTNCNLNYTYHNWTLGLVVENLFDTEWNETQFATESRLFNEAAAVEEIHFTPGTPFFLKAKLSLRF